MAEEVKGFAEHFAGFKRHWKLSALTFIVIMMFGVGLAYSLKDIYSSSGFILIEEAEIPEEIIRSTVTTYTTQQVTKLNERILTINNLVRLIEEYDLYKDKRKGTPTELLAFNAREAISVQIQTRETVTPQGLPRPIAVGFTVAFEDEDPQTAKDVATELVGLYLEENRKVRSEQTTETSDFLKTEVVRLESDLAGMETQLARFKEANADTLPSVSPVNMSQMNRIDTQLLEIQRQLDAIEDNRIAIQAQLATVEPTMPSRLPDGTMVLAPQDQLKSLQTQLSVYESRYSDDHPDVVRTRADIDSIKKRFGLDVNLAELSKSLVNTRSQLAVAQERYTSDHPDVVRLTRTVEELQQQIAKTGQRQLDSSVTPDNPAYIQLVSTLERLNGNEAALKTERRELQSRMNEYERRLLATPQVERDLASLSRQLSSTANRYWVMRDKQFTAEMGESLETQSKGESLMLIEPPRIPLRPIKPDRGAIIALTFLFAVVCGLAISQLADALDHSIRGASAIANVQGAPPLVEIPYIFNKAEIEKARRMRKLSYAAAPAVVAVMAIIVHFVFLPLDVLFFAAIQRLGL